MEEKIKIYVPEDIYFILLKDMELFEFFKKDHSLNLNAFLNTLIVNYYETYNSNNQDTYDYILDTLEETKLSEFEISDIANKVISFVERRNLELDTKLSTVTLSIKPTKASSKVFDYIQTFLLHDSSLSNWFRNLLASYTRLPQDKRELIIFKESYEAISEALDKNKKIYFINPSNDKKHIVKPYAICNSKEELFNYLLCEEFDKSYSFRLTRIKNVSILNEECSFTDDMISIFKKMIEYGPQYAYNQNDSEQIIVRLTERGRVMYEKMYIHRPAYTKVEGDLFYFECSASQAMNYFVKLGKNAVVVYPEKLQKNIYDFYVMSSKAYRKEYQSKLEKKENLE